MENASTALIIATSILIAMLLTGLMVFAFQSVSTFAQKQITVDEIAEISQFNQPFLEFNAKATHDFSGKSIEIPIGATAEDVLSIINYTNHVKTTTPYRVEFILELEGKIIRAEDFTSEKQQEFIQKDLEARETDLYNNRLKYSCDLEYSNDDIAPRVEKVKVKIIK